MNGVDELEKINAGWQGGTSMSAELNKALVRRFLEAHEGKADLQALDQMLAPDFVSHIKRLPGQQPDREGYKWAITQYSAAFSDRKFLVEEQVAEGSRYQSGMLIGVGSGLCGLPRTRHMRTS